MPDPKTKWTQLEPPGFGLSPFGHPSTGKLPETGEDVSILKPHDRGFGEPTTVWTEYTGD